MTADRRSAIYLISLLENAMDHNVLMHEAGDDVGVAIVDLKPGSQASAVTLEGQPVEALPVVEDIPLGHKIAMRDLAEGKPVVKYGRPIGRAVQAIARGAHVHTHNVKSLRW
jgi:(2R)-sulfolactate sulfo-lyase subunit alpha